MLRFLLFALILFLQCFEGWAQSVHRPAEWAQPLSSKYIENWYRVSHQLYRSHQPNRKGFEEAKKEGIRSILSLRTSYSDQSAIENLNFVYYQVPMTPDSVTLDQVVKALKFIDLAPKPVLVHCVRGADRTGLVIAMYRIVFENWTRDQAIEEMIKGGFGFCEDYRNIPLFLLEVNVDSVRIRLRP